MKLLIIIPAKLDSKRLEKKNIQQINNKTLVEHSIDYAKSSNYEKEFLFQESFNMNSISDKLEEQDYEENIQSNLTNIITRKLILQLSLVK